MGEMGGGDKGLAKYRLAIEHIDGLNHIHTLARRIVGVRSTPTAPTTLRREWRPREVLLFLQLYGGARVANARE